MNLYLIGFIAVAFMITVGGAYQLNSSNLTYGAGLFFIGALILFIVYGIRWFGSTPLFTPASGPWPPVINSCPDYLTYYQRTVDGVKKDTCIDTIGVSKDNSILKTFPKDGSIPTDDHYYLDITGMNTNPTKQCNAAMASKVTWEGVSNGESCVTAAAAASGSSGASGASGSSGSGSGCPA